MPTFLHASCARARQRAIWAPTRLSAPSLLPAAIAGALSIALSLSQFDLWLADQLFALQGGRWTLTQHPFLETGMHQLGKRVSVAAWLVAVASTLYALITPEARTSLRPLAYLVFSLLIATTTVSLLKQVSAVDCPWDLARYGGQRPYLDLLETLAQANLRGGCYPAGHAGAGYAWVALYFAMSVLRPRARWVGLAVGIGVGLAFGVGQQLRGAHFVSHDVMTFAVCWAVAWIAFRLFGLNAARRAPAALGTSP